MQQSTALFHSGFVDSKPCRIFQPGGVFSVLCASQLTTDHPFQTFRTHANPVSSENLKEAANFFSTSNSTPLLHTPSSPFDFASLKNGLPVVSHQSPQLPMSLPEMLQKTTQSGLSGAAWASDFMSFQQAQPSSPSKQVTATLPPVGMQNVQQQPLQNPGL